MPKEFKSTRVLDKPFTPVTLDRFKPEIDRYEVSEPSGLRIVIGKKAKTFVFRYKSPEDGKARKLNIGRYPAKKLKEARDDMAAAREQIDQGVDPADIKLRAKQAKRDSITVAELVNEYISAVSSKKKSWQEDQGFLVREVLPRFGAMKAEAVTRRDILEMVDEIHKRAPTAANRTLIYTRLAFAHGVYREYFSINPAADIKPPHKPESRQRVLTEEEIQKFWMGVDAMKCSGNIKAILKLTLVTAQRVGEVRQMRWSDIEGDWWTVPPEHSKNGLAHRVYLSSLAIQILDEVRQSGDSHGSIVFAGKNHDSFMGRNSPDQALRRSEFPVEDFHIHDLRRTAGSHMTATGIPRLVLAKVLNHAERGVTQVYDRHSYDHEKRDALGKWARRLTDIITGQFNAIEKTIADLHEKFEQGNVEVAFEVVRSCLENRIMPPDWALSAFLKKWKNVPAGFGDELMSKLSEKNITPPTEP